MNLKDMLARDFGLNINISGGSGRNYSDPIVILDTNSYQALDTQMKLLLGLGMGRAIYWRVLERSTQQSGDCVIEKIEIETKELTESEIITQQEVYYFDVSRVKSNSDKLQEIISYSDNKLGLYMPFELGWLHFREVINHEPVVAGLGCGIAYGAPGIKATIFIYDKTKSRISDDINSEQALDEFKQAVFEFIEVHPSASSLGELSKRNGFLLQPFAFGGDFTIIGLTVFKNNFIKLRVTHIQDHFLIEVSNDFIRSVSANLLHTLKTDY
jgi:hypothetical protein